MITTRPEPMAGTQSILRAVAMLEAFSDTRPAWSVADLADVVGLNRTTAYRLLTALESVEYVVRDPGNETYRLGSGLIALGSRAQRANPIRIVSLPELEALANETGETATLEILSGHETVIIEEVPGDFVTSGSQHIGTRWPVHATSTGKAMLAHMESDEVNHFLTQPLTPFTEKTITRKKQLRACLEAVRERGYAAAVEELELGFVAIGAPIFNAEGRVMAALSLGGTRVRLTEARIPEFGRLVRDAANRISRRLGYRLDHT
jgi:IclR family transcriptional regulator, acetate operon repressor